MAKPEGGSPSLAARRWVVSGRVQGVGFRWFVLNRAQAADLGAGAGAGAGKAREGRE